MANVMNDLKQYSDDFVESQTQYYKKHLGSGNFFDRGYICAQYHVFLAEYNRRQKLKELTQ